MPQSGVAEFREDRSPHDERVAARNAARAALLEWDARERELEARDRERLPSAVRALDDWSTSEHEAMEWSAEDPPAPVNQATPERDEVAPADGHLHAGSRAAGRSPSAARWPTAMPRHGPAHAGARSGAMSAPASALTAPHCGRCCLGVMLILAAVTSAHAATLHTLAHLH